VRSTSVGRGQITGEMSLPSSWEFDPLSSRDASARGVKIVEHAACGGGRSALEHAACGGMRSAPEHTACGGVRSAL
jgi:hypothetical protein